MKKGNSVARLGQAGSEASLLYHSNPIVVESGKWCRGFLVLSKLEKGG